MGLFAYSMGFRIDAVLLPVVGSISFGMFAPLVTVVWIAGVQNAINLIDGLDVLAGGIVFFAAITNFAVGFVAVSTLSSLFMAAIAGAVRVFLLYNWYPAKVYMGDSGSYFFGLYIGHGFAFGSGAKGVHNGFHSRAGAGHGRAYFRYNVRDGAALSGEKAGIFSRSGPCAPPPFGRWNDAAPRGDRALLCERAADGRGTGAGV